jgi:CheY-like chemotaxis protein/HEAT repeat protein
VAIESSHIIEELQANIQSRDKIKAKIIIDHLKDLDESTAKLLLFELTKAPENFIVPVLAGIIAGEPQLAYFTDLKNIFYQKIVDSPPAIMRLLQDKQFPDKKPFIKAAGAVQCVNSVPIILNILRTTTDMELGKICLQALGNIGDPHTVTDISDYLYSGNRELTKTAVEALKEMDTQESIARLIDRIGTDHELDKKIIDALGELQDHQSIKGMNDLMLAHDAIIRNHAKSKLVEIGAKAVPILIENLKIENADLQIHTLNVLALIGDISAAQPIRKFLFNDPKDANARFAAYETLGELPLKKGAFVLTSGLNDPESQVQIAAARALEKNMDLTIIAGIKNLISGGKEEALRIIKAFINAEAERIFIELLENKDAAALAIEYLLNEAHPDIRSRYISVLKKNHFDKLARQLEGHKAKKADAGTNMIFAVDDSRMILKIYKSALHKLNYQSQLFEFPESALERLNDEKPALLITDLNMPEITGIELTQAVREKYPKSELPIIMVTTQQDLEDREAAFNAGINGILYKPFTTEQLKEEIDKCLR